MFVGIGATSQRQLACCRVAADGKLHGVQPTPSIGQQFPLYCNVVRDLVGGTPWKVQHVTGAIDLSYPLKYLRVQVQDLLKLCHDGLVLLPLWTAATAAPACMLRPFALNHETGKA